jgi:hypothetical protein
MKLVYRSTAGAAPFFKVGKDVRARVVTTGDMAVAGRRTIDG